MPRNPFPIIPGMYTATPFATKVRVRRDEFDLDLVRGGVRGVVAEVVEKVCTDMTMHSISRWFDDVVDSV